MSLTNDEITANNFKDFYRKILPYLVRGNNGYSETPIGAMQMFDDDAAPSGWLIADGTVYNISDYPFLAKHFEHVHGSKNYYGGDGTTTFAVPNWQGEFFRASGTNSHANQGSGGNVGEHQDGTEHLGGYGWNNGQVSFTYSGNTGGLNADYRTALTRSYANGTYNSSELLGSKYTSRPTNTSLLCCIKAVPAGVNYSTEEQEIGTWIDGKPLYQKTFNITIDTTITAEFYRGTVNHGISDIKEICDLRVVALNGTFEDELYQGYYTSGIVTGNTTGSRNVSTGLGAWGNKTVLQILTNDSNFAGKSAYVTLQYTKTTD